MFSGSWGTISTSGGGSASGTWSTGTGAPAGSGWSTGTAPSGSGWLSSPSSPTTATAGDGGSYGTGTYQSGGSGYYGYYQAPTYPGAGLSFGPYGEGGPYTPLDFPLMHELRPGQRLEDLNPQSGLANNKRLRFLALGVIAFLLLKGK